MMNLLLDTRSKAYYPKSQIRRDPHLFPRFPESLFLVRLLLYQSDYLQMYFQYDNLGENPFAQQMECKRFELG